MRGKLVFNGNMGSFSTFLERVRPQLLSSAGGKTPRVLLVTAAWGNGERNDGGLREALVRAGIPLDHIANLGAFGAQRSYLAAHPEVAEVAAELAEVAEATRSLYVEKTAFHATRIRSAVKFVQARVPDFHLGDLPLVARDPLRPEATLSGKALLARAATRELLHDLDDLVAHDARMLAALTEAEVSIHVRTGIRFDPHWRALRDELANGILAADAVILMGGEPLDLLGALRFFDLGPALTETLRRGATFFGMSAGTLVLCERIIVYDDYNPDPARREFRLIDSGLGIVGGIQVLPHCMDRIHTDDPDNLAYLSRRFSSHACLGLNEESFLLVDLGANQAFGVGSRDGVYVFGADGVKWKYHQGEQIPLV